MKKHLESSEVINWKTPELLSAAKNLASAKSSTEDIAQRCFTFVRDEIKHSLDYKLNPVTCKASDVLKYGTGYCYAKSHLLAALLRANNIPASLCYQRLTINGNTAPFCLHGLNAVFLEKYGWYRIDARGNSNDIDAGFCPPQEKLAFSILHKGESDLLENYSEPLPSVINTLMTYDSYIDVSNSLPDIEPT